MRLVSLLPSATEIVHAIGLGDSLVGVTHECDYPHGVKRLPRLTANLLSPDLGSREIDHQVSASLKADAHTIYALDTDLLCTLQPDVILTQALCEVCAVPTSMVEDAVCTMPAGARIVSLDPLNLEAVFASIEDAGDVLDARLVARESASRLREQLAGIRDAVAGAPRPRVLAAEWLDPVYCGGHWVPEMIDAAGGADPFGTPGEASHPLTWETIAGVDPDVIVLMPCGYFAPQVVERYHEIAAAPQWRTLRAVRAGDVYAVDATSYFSRPGPRLVEGTRLLAKIMHPGRFDAHVAPGVAYRLDAGGDWTELR